MGLRFALLNANEDGTHNRRNFRRELDADLVEYDVADGDLPQEYAFDACVVSGSRASVYREEPWIDDLREWVAEAVERSLPVLGVCFGHQLLADALGGRVEPMDGYEIGYRTVERTGESILLEGLDREFTVFTTHSDRVVELPVGATPIASNDYGIQGFRRGQAFAVQFHPEYDRETAVDVVRGKADELDESAMEAALASVTDENYAAACETKRLFDAFVEYVRDRENVGTDDATPPSGT